MFAAGDLPTGDLKGQFPNLFAIDIKGDFPLTVEFSQAIIFLHQQAFKNVRVCPMQA